MPSFDKNTSSEEHEMPFGTFITDVIEGSDKRDSSDAFITAKQK